MSRSRWQVLLVSSLLMISSQMIWSQASTGHPPVTLKREYRNGETLAYHMKAVNEGHLRTIRYEAEASGKVTEGPAGRFIESVAWTGLIVNGEPLTLTPASQEFRQSLSLSPEYTLSVPDLSKVQPMLIGPIADLLTFYADVQLAMRQKDLFKTGDHVYVKHGIPSSWADGTYTIFGQDSVDFDITLTKVNGATHEATLLIRHVPPAKGQIPFPVAWMEEPVGKLPNNWAEVERADGKYLAEVGEELFEVTIKLSIPSGRIVSAEMDNSVDVLECDCEDAALMKCNDPVQYRIHRQISLESTKPD